VRNNHDVHMSIIKIDINIDISKQRMRKLFLDAGIWGNALHKKAGCLLQKAHCNIQSDEV
jgi:hypothetical protein